MKFFAFKIFSILWLLSGWLLYILVCSSLDLYWMRFSVLPGLGWLSHVREVFSYYLFKYLLILFTLLILFIFSLLITGTSVMRMLICLMLSQRSLKLSSFLFILLLKFCFMAVISTILSSSSLTYSSASFIMLLICSSVLFIAVSVLFILVCLFFSSSRSLLNSSCIFWVCASVLYLRSWISFTVSSPNSFLGWFPISVSLSCFSGVLSWPSFWNISLCSHLLFFCNCCLHCTGCRFLFLLAANVCHLVHEAHLKGLCNLC